LERALAIDEAALGAGRLAVGSARKDFSAVLGAFDMHQREGWLRRLIGRGPSMPAWGRRPAAMVAKCEWALDFITRWARDSEAGRVQ
jgi:hypothetical protein